MRISANLGFLYTDLPLPDRIRAAKRDGFDAVECHFPYDTPVAETRAALDETGLPMLSLNTAPGRPGTGDFGLAALPGRAEEARAAVAQAVAYGAAVGAGWVHVMAGKSAGAAGAEEAFRATLSLACDLAAAQGMGVLIEPLNPRDVPRINVAKAAAAEFGDAAQVDELLTSRNIYPEDVRLWRERCPHATSPLPSSVRLYWPPETPHLRPRARRRSGHV